MVKYGDLYSGELHISSCKRECVYRFMEISWLWTAFRPSLSLKNSLNWTARFTTNPFFFSILVVYYFLYFFLGWPNGQEWYYQSIRRHVWYLGVLAFFQFLWDVWRSMDYNSIQVICCYLTKKRKEKVWVLYSALIVYSAWDKSYLFSATGGWINGRLMVGQGE